MLCAELGCPLSSKETPVLISVCALETSRFCRKILCNEIDIISLKGLATCQDTSPPKTCAKEPPKERVEGQITSVGEVLRGWKVGKA